VTGNNETKSAFVATKNSQNAPFITSRTLGLAYVDTRTMMHTFSSNPKRIESGTAKLINVDRLAGLQEAVILFSAIRPEPAPDVAAREHAKGKWTALPAHAYLGAATSRTGQWGRYDQRRLKWFSRCVDQKGHREHTTCSESFKENGCACVEGM
jgi:hypothetical protein